MAVSEDAVAVLEGQSKHPPFGSLFWWPNPQVEWVFEEINLLLDDVTWIEIVCLDVWSEYAA